MWIVCACMSHSVVYCMFLVSMRMQLLHVGKESHILLHLRYSNKMIYLGLHISDANSVGACVMHTWSLQQNSMHKPQCIICVSRNLCLHKYTFPVHKDISVCITTHCMDAENSHQILNHLLTSFSVFKS